MASFSSCPSCLELEYELNGCSLLSVVAFAKNPISSTATAEMQQYDVARFLKLISHNLV